jgi:transcriptional regulator with XRE-family HTH domain
MLNTIVLPRQHLRVSQTCLSLAMDTIADRMAACRVALDLTQQELAKKAGVRQTTIGNIEAGLRKRPRDLLAIAKALNVNAEWLQSGTGPKTPSEKTGASADPKWVGHKWAGKKPLTTAQNKLWQTILLFLEDLPDDQCGAIDTMVKAGANRLEPAPKVKRKVRI